MLTRQKAILALLRKADGPLPATVFVKLMFLLKWETDVRDESGFYDFVPYRFGPFSFTLYREMAALRRDGYVAPDESPVGVKQHALNAVDERIRELPAAFRRGVEDVFERYGRKDQTSLLRDVYARYPWYAAKSELAHMKPDSAVLPCRARPAVYTMGYEGRSVEAFFDRLLKEGIEAVVDVRANPISRRYGFSKGSLTDICAKLGLSYRHEPCLGIPSRLRADLSDADSYKRLLDKYQTAMLPLHEHEMERVGRFMAGTAAVLVCFERDVRFCHRGRLAEALRGKTGLEVRHL